MAYHSSHDPDEQFDYLFKIVLIGDAGVGKTCMVQRFKSGTYTEKHGSTIGVDFTMKTLNIDGKLVKVSDLLCCREFSSANSLIHWFFLLSKDLHIGTCLQLLSHS